MSRHTGSIVLVALLAACSTSGDGAKASASSDSTSRPKASVAAANAELTERAADSVQAVGVPTAVADVGTHGEDLYDQAKAANWGTATAILDSLSRSASALTSAEQRQLRGVLDTLQRAVAGHQRDEAVEAANRVTFIGAALTEAYHPKMPADIVRLDYYGREIEIWAARRDMTRLSAVSADLRRTWGAIKPSVVGHGGAVAAARMDALVGRLAAAHSSTDYQKLATPILDLVDELEKPFEK